MNTLQQMQMYSDSFTPTDRRIYDVLLADPNFFFQCTTTMAAQHVGVSQSAISRFCQKVGFESFGDFRTSLLLSLSQNTQETPREATGDAADYLCALIQATSREVSPRRRTEICRRILDAHTVYTTGGGLSAPPAQTLALELLKHNLRCYCIDSGDEMLYMHAASADDLVIVFSSKNDTQRTLVNVLQETPEKRRPKTLMVAHTAAHPLRKYVDDLVLLPTWQSEGLPVYIEPMTSMLAFSSLIMAEISQMLGRSPATLPPLIAGRPMKEG